jgi:large subunit ribosomal protein L24
MIKKHVRPNPNINEKGGVKSQESPLSVANVAIYNPTTNKADRVGFKTLADGKKVRVYKKTGEQIDV